MQRATTAIDFTSCHYLGLAHPSRSLPSWDALSTGQPAVLAESSAALALAADIAALQGAESGVIAPSTLHVFRDLFTELRQSSVVVFIDRGAYPVMRWGLGAASGRDACSHTFEHFDVESCERSMHRHRRNGYRPVVVSDGCCPTCSRLAPLRELSELVRVHGGTLVLDLSQSLGLWGEAPSRGDVYGLGGGGAARHAGVRGDHVVTVASLSKSFAAPLAVACGPAALIARLRDAGSRLHASPPAAPSVLAARRALDLNARLGRSLRRRLAARVIRFKRELSQRGIETVEGLHPVQLLAAQRGSRGASAAWAERVAQRLHAQGVRALVLNGHERRPRLAFALSARHSIQNVVAAADALNVALGRAVVF